MEFPGLEEIKNGIQEGLRENDARKVDYYNVFWSLVETHLFKKLLEEQNIQGIDTIKQYLESKIQYLMGEITKFEVTYQH